MTKSKKNELRINMMNFVNKQTQEIIHNKYLTDDKKKRLIMLLENAVMEILDETDEREK